MNTNFQRFRPRATLIDALFAVLAGSLFPLGFAPLSLWPLSLFALITLWCLLQRPTGLRQPFLIGWLFGIGTYGVGTSWIFVSIYYFGNVPLTTSVVVTLAFVALIALSTGLSTWIYQRLAQGLHLSPLQGGSVALKHTGIFTASWVIVEWIRTWLLTGFPWLFMGYAGLDTAFEGYGPILGVFGVSAFMIFSAILMASAFWYKKHILFATVCVSVIWLIGLSLSHINWTRPNAESHLAVYLLQGNIPQIQKRDPSFFDEHLQTYIDMTETLWEASPTNTQPHLVIWPEAAIPTLLHMTWDIYNTLDNEARDANAAWISGVPWADIDGENTVFHNGILAAGIGSGFYVKQKLVPFGESIPFPDITHKLGPLFHLSPVGFTPGDAQQKPLIAQGLRIAPFICYEVVFPSLVRRYATKADVLLTISNDGWFGQSFGPDQHFQMARMRALETGKMLLRDTNNGITAIIDEHGKVIRQLPTFVRATLAGTVYSTTGKTPFLLLGSWPTLLSAFGVLALASVYGLRRRTNQREKVSNSTQAQPKANDSHTSYPHTRSSQSAAVSVHTEQSDISATRQKPINPLVKQRLAVAQSNNSTGSPENH